MGDLEKFVEKDECPCAGPFFALFSWNHHQLKDDGLYKARQEWHSSKVFFTFFLLNLHSLVDAAKHIENNFNKVNALVCVHVLSTDDAAEPIVTLRMMVAMMQDKNVIEQEYCLAL